MICYRDTTFCASPNCKDKCGRKPPADIAERAEKWWNPKDKPELRDQAPIAYSFYCGGSWDDVAPSNAPKDGKFRIRGSVQHPSFGLLSDQEMDYLKYLHGNELKHETRRLLRNAKARQRAMEKKEGKRQAAYPEGEQLFLFEVEHE